MGLKKAEKRTIVIAGFGTKEIDLMQSQVQLLVNNLDADSLAIISEKSKKPGINKKIKQFKNLI